MSDTQRARPLDPEAEDVLVGRLEDMAGASADAEIILRSLAAALFPEGPGDLSRVTWRERPLPAARPGDPPAAELPVGPAATEARLRLAETRYRTLVEQIPAVTFLAVLGEGTNEIYVSPHIEALLGFTQEEWLENPILWWSQLHPDDRLVWNDEFARGCRTGGPFRAECRFIARDGHVVWVHGEARVIKDHLGRPLFLQGVAFDITESKRAQETRLRDAIQSTEQRYRDLVQGLGAIFWEAEAASGRFTFVSWQAEHILGYPIARWLEPDFRAAIFHPPEREARVAELRGALAEGRDHKLEYRAVAVDGRVVWLHEIVNVARDARGQPRHLFGIMLDVTDRKRAEQRAAALYAVTQVLAAASTLDTAAPRILDAICEHLDWEGGMLWIAEGQGRALRCIEMRRPPAVVRLEAAGRSAQGLAARVLAAGRPLWVHDVARQPELAPGLGWGWARAACGFPTVLGDAITGVVTLFSREARRPDEEQLRLMDALGSQIGQFVERARAEQERTELLAREREARVEAETLNRLGRSVAAELDLQKLMQGVTDAATDLAGARSGAFFYHLPGRTTEPYALSGAGREAFTALPAPLKFLLSDSTHAGERVVRLDDVAGDDRGGPHARSGGGAGGQPQMRSCLAVPVVSRSGEVLGTLLVGHPEPDRFTERHERILVGIAAQAAVAIDNARLYQQAQLAIRAREAFLARAAHELRTPLTSALGTVRLLGRAIAGTLKERPAELTEIAVRNLNAMLALVNDLLDASKLASGQEQLALAPVDLTDAIARSLEIVGVEARDKGLQLEMAIPAGLVALADRLKLEQVLVNLLANAVKFTPPDGRVTVTAEYEEGEAVIRVRDTGVGIRREHLDAIFEPFFQSEPNGPRRPRGTGLGLAICRQIVSLHEGSIVAESEGRGCGSTFTVRFRGAVVSPAAGGPPAD
jgi:PAS domain S-box-containing protein